MKKILSTVFAAFAAMMCLGACAGTGTGGETKKTYDNPVYEPVFADPCVVRHEGVYYAYATEDYGKWSPTDDELDDESNVKCVPILKSDNLTKWYYAGSAFRGVTKPAWGTFGANVWAPDVVKIGDKFIMYYALSTWGDPDPGIGIATADHPLGPWSDRGKLFTSSEIGVNNSIDAAVFTGDNGEVYMIWGSFRGLYGVRLTDDGLGLMGGIDSARENKVHIAGLDTSAPWNGATYEAPYVVKKDGYYYMFVSSGTCCEGFSSTYNVRVARSESPLGEYTDDRGRSMLGENRGALVVEGSTQFVGTGHNCVITDDGGNYYMLYHAFDAQFSTDKYGTTNRRALLADKLNWDGDFPFAEGRKAGRSKMPAPIINGK